MKSKHEPRQDTRRQKKQISTYPSDLAWELLGGGASTVATAAVECWAQALAEATLANEDSFGPDDWVVLAAWLRGRNVHEIVYHSIRAPSVIVSMALSEGYGGDSARLQAVADKIRALDYVHVWAMLWALDWKQRSGAEGEWWTLAARLRVTT